MAVFVFGTNGQGFHGAGAAAFAMFGKEGAYWRKDKVPGTNKYLNEVPDGTKGVYAVKGQSRGLMEGTSGFSYGIQTVTRPGQKRSVPLEEIQKQLEEMCLVACEHSGKTFLLTLIGTGYAGYTKEEIEQIFSKVNFPSNIRRI